MSMTAAHLGILERHENGQLRLVLSGELDLASAPLLQDRLAQLAAAQTPVRLDLSRLEFIDSTGLHALVRATKDAQTNGWRLHIDPATTPQVKRLFEIVGLEQLIPGYDSNGRGLSRGGVASRSVSPHWREHA
jgi:anti-sigma B factor antagonist